MACGQRRQRMRNGRIQILGSPLDPVTMAEAIARVDEAVRARQPLQNASLNAAKLVRMQSDSELREAVAACGLVTADGKPVVWAGRLLGHEVPERVNGTDLMELLLAHAEERGYSVFLFGSTEDVLAGARAEVERRHPRLRLAGTQHGYFSPAEEPKVVERIAASQPDILFVALGTPEKELFQERHRDALNVPFIMGVGGSFEVLAGKRSRAPRWAQRAGLEWLFRLAQEPRRLGGRYVVGNTRFVLLVGREMARRRKRSSS
jgi:N-acetylglucosaminyldiphosphoundecaprenol N-acetyl-beta-D-mannosaminyltransferase